VETSALKAARRFAVVMAVLAIACGPALARSKKHEDTNTRSVQGLVTDAANNPVFEAIVQLKDTKTLTVRSYITQKDGMYHFSGLSPDVDYELKAEHNGSSSSSKTLSVFDDRKLVTLNLKLKK
jgi:Carboxypeptidase regulatory-like domain